jgi:hypothetical protein
MKRFTIIRVTTNEFQFPSLYLIIQLLFIQAYYIAAPAPSHRSEIKDKLVKLKENEEYRKFKSKVNTGIAAYNEQVEKCSLIRRCSRDERKQVEKQQLLWAVSSL